MNELSEILGALRRAGRSGDHAVLATIVKTVGSSYRRPGARMLFPASGEPVGFISGGCLEGDLAERARAVLHSGETRTVLYDMRSPDDVVWGLGLGCNGAVTVLLERLAPEDLPGYLVFLDACAHDRRPGAVATLFSAARLPGAAIGQRVTLEPAGRPTGMIGEARLHESVVEDLQAALSCGRSAVRAYTVGPGSAEVLIEHVAPEISLLIFGAGRDAVPLVRLGAELGWRVTVADNRPAYAIPGRFPEAEDVRLVDFAHLDRSAPPIDARTVVVVMTHHFLHDLDLLAHVLSSAAPYVGVLGPAKRTENLLSELKARGVEPTPGQRTRLHGPLGLDIGAETAEEVALAALAEMQAVLGDRRGGFLRNRTGPLHDELTFPEMPAGDTQR